MYVKRKVNRKIDKANTNQKRGMKRDFLQCDIRASIHNEHILPLSVDLIIVSKYMKKWKETETNIKEKAETNPHLSVDFNTPLSILDRKKQQELSKDIQA